MNTAWSERVRLRRTYSIRTTYCQWKQCLSDVAPVARNPPYFPEGYQQTWEIHLLFRTAGWYTETWVSFGSPDVLKFHIKRCNLELLFLKYFSFLCLLQWDLLPQTDDDRVVCLAMNADALLNV